MCNLKISAWPVVPSPFWTQNATLTLESPCGDSPILLDFDPPLLHFESPPMVLPCALTSRLGLLDYPLTLTFARLAIHSLLRSIHPSPVGPGMLVAVAVAPMSPATDHRSLESWLFWWTDVQAHPAGRLR